MTIHYFMYYNKMINIKTYIVLSAIITGIIQLPQVVQELGKSKTSQNENGEPSIRAITIFNGGIIMLLGIIIYALCSRCK